jgi:type VI secretion system VasD/TssJ family lipoprotein
MRSLVILLPLLCLVLVGCGGPRQVNLPVRGVAPLNPNDAQESTPVDVRVWPLAAPDRFRAATVDQLWTDAKAALGPDLLGDPRVFTVFPGGPTDPVVEQRLEVPASTSFLGVLAMCQRSDAQDQRATVVAIDEAEKLGLMLTGFSVQLVIPATPAAPATP